MLHLLFGSLAPALSKHLSFLFRFHSVAVGDISLAQCYFFSSFAYRKGVRSVISWRQRGGMLFEAVALACLSNKRPDTIVLVAVAVRCSVGSSAARTTFSAQPALEENQRQSVAALCCSFALVFHWCHFVGLHGCPICDEEDEALPESKLRSEAMPGTRCVACVLKN